MKILFACGGTAGHINPALSVAGTLKKQDPSVEILFAGSPRGMEARLVQEAGYRFAPITIKGFQRQLNLRNLKNNLQAVGYLATSTHRAKKILRAFAPDVVMGTGGYVSGPILRCAHKLGIKTLTQEQNAFPGVTTKLLSHYVDKVLLAVPQAQKYLYEKADCTVTGNPVREEVIFASRKAARERMGVGDKICIVSFGGSLGARRVNEAIADVMAWHAGSGKIHHIHATGAYGTELLPRLLREKGVAFENNPDLDIREYIRDMPDCLAAADLVICRAGAITLSELQAAGRASILIPSPNVAENHQYYNAMALAEQDAAVVLEEKDLTGQRLTDLVKTLCGDPERLGRLSRNAARMAILDANERICREIQALYQKK